MNSELLNGLLLLRFSNSHISALSLSFLLFTAQLTQRSGVVKDAQTLPDRQVQSFSLPNRSNKLKTFFVAVLSSSACPNVLDCGRETPALHARHRLLVILRRRAARGGGVLSLDR